MILKMCLGNLRDFKKIKTINKLSKKSLALKYTLNAEQKDALKNLTNLGNKFKVSVLLGITGSGKTLVYFERIKELIKKKKQVLILIPEIFLTTQFKKDLSYFLDMNLPYGIRKLVKVKKKYLAFSS